MLDPVGVKLAALYPLPNQAGTVDGRNNHFWPDVARSDYYAHMSRLDHAFSESHRVLLRLHYAFFQNDKNDSFGTRTNSLLINQIKRGIALDDVIVLSPTLVLNLRYGLNNADFLVKRASRGIDLTTLGFSPALVALVDKNLATIPRVSLGAYSVLSQWQDGDGGNTAVTNSFQAGFTMLYGRHNSRFGADFRIYRTFGNRAPATVSPDLSYSTNYTRGPLDNSPAATVGQELASMLMGVPGGSMEYAASYAMQDKFFALYFQDDVRLTSRLTLNLGVRYETEWPLTERFNRLVADFDAAAANPIEAQARANYARSPIPEIAPADFRVRAD